MEVYLAGLINNRACFSILGYIIYCGWCMVVQPELYNRYYHFAIAYRGDLFLFNSTLRMYIYLRLPKLLHKMGDGYAANTHRLQRNHHILYLNTDNLSSQVIHPGNVYATRLPGNPVPVYL
jgi:hypothetical protein